MTDKEFNAHKALVRVHCIRGKGWFCDGSPNGVKGERLGKCKFRQGGKCMIIAEAKARCKEAKQT